MQNRVGCRTGMVWCWWPLRRWVFRAARRPQQCAASWNASSRRCWTNRNTPCDDFYDYACSKWQAAHPIPADMPSVGTWTPLYLWNQTILREAMEKAAADPAGHGNRAAGGRLLEELHGPGSARRQGQAVAGRGAEAGGRDEEQGGAGEAAGASARRAGCRPLRASDNQTNTALFGFGPTQDLVDSSMMVAGFDQGGTVAGLARLLPERRRGVEEDPRRVPQAPGAHVPAGGRLAGAGGQGGRRRSLRSRPRWPRRR